MASEAIPLLFGTARDQAGRPLFRTHAVCALIVLVVLTASPRFNDPDLWWHLKVGEVIWTTHSIPDRDLFSHTAAGHPWMAHEWLAQLSLFAAYHWAGYSGIMLWLCLLAALLVVGLYVLCALYSGDHFAGLLGAALGWFFATIGFAARPLLLGHLLLVVELLLIELGRTRDRRWLYGLPVVFAVWSNCHGSFSLGLVVLAATVTTAFVRRRWGRLIPTDWDERARRTLVLSAALSLPALCLNATGVRTLAYPLDVFLSQKIGLAQVQEWAPLPVADSRYAALLGVFALLFAVILAERGVLQLKEVILLGGSAYMALQHSRLVFAFGILAAPVVSRIMAAMLGPDRKSRSHPLLNAALVACSACIAVAAFPGKASLEAQTREDNPHAAVDFIRRSKLAGPMLNDYDWGGYLIWSLPEHKVFVDGRSDVYEWAGVLDDYAGWSTLRENPVRLLEKHGVRFCILRADRPIARIIPLLPGWKEAFRDKTAVVFVRSLASSLHNSGPDVSPHR